MKQFSNFCLSALMLLIGTQAIVAQEIVSFSIDEATLGTPPSGLALRVSNFDQVIGLQFTVGWDVNQLILDSLSDFSLAGLNAESFNIDSLAGSMRLIWFDPSISGFDLTDDTALFSFYFSATTNAADTNYIDFLSNPTIPTVVQLDGDDITEGPPNLIGGHLRISPPLSVSNVNIEAVSCFGEADGSIEIEVFGGQDPYTFYWDDMIGTNTLVDLAAGMYTLVLVDQSGDSLQSIYQVLSPDSLVLSYQSSDASCIGAADGQIDLSVAGGSPPYTYDWTNGSEEEDQIAIPGGTYGLQVSDANNCNSELTINIQAEELIQNISIQSPTCEGVEDGSISIETIDLANIEYQWNINNNSNTLVDISSGTYTVTVSHPSGCTQSETIFLEAPLAIANEVSIRYGCGDGFVSLAANPVGDIESFSYLWSTGSDSREIFGLEAGTYFLTLSNEAGCTEIDTVVVEFEPPFMLEGMIDPISCFSEADGQITLLLSGGGPPYSFSWTDGETSQNRTELTAGEYGVNISSEGGCNWYESFTINEPAQLDVSFLIVEESNNLFQVTAAPIGGVFPYSFDWSSGDTGTTVENLAAGNYTLTITDANNCTAVFDFFVGATSVFSREGIIPLSVFPNPSRGLFRLDLSGHQIIRGEINVYNLSGKKIRQLMSIGPNKPEIDLRDQAAGIYFLEIVSEDKRYFSKLLKQ